MIAACGSTCALKKRSCCGPTASVAAIANRGAPFRFLVPLVGIWLAALAAGQGNRRALGLGALMNARGLTELIILNIGLQAGIIGPALFSMLVLMAIVTTLMASPLFELVYGHRARARGDIPPLPR